MHQSRHSARSTGFDAYTHRIVVDKSGQLHDPDYCQFPIATVSPPPRRHGRVSPRPYWEINSEYEHALDDEYEDMLLDEEEEGASFLSSATHPQYHQRYASSPSRRSSHPGSNTRNLRRPRDSSFSTYTSYSPTYYSPSITTSTLPTSYESDNTVFSFESPFDEKEKKSMLLGAAVAKKRRRLSKGDREKDSRSSIEHSRDLPPTREEELHDSMLEKSGRTEEARGDDEQQVIMGHERELEFVPTCTQSLHRQWQAFALRFRFGVFRAQRKMMRRVHSIL